MQPPQVRDLQGLISELGASVAPQKQLIDQSIASNEQYGTAQQAGLNAKKVQAFQDIKQGANNRGMFFSGFSPDQEAKYTAGTYLPALAELQNTIAQTRSSLLGKKADLDTDVFKTAYNTREGDVAAQRAWLQQQENQAWQEGQTARAQQFQSAQNALDRSASVTAAAAGRSGEPTPQQNYAAALSAKTGGDGKVSPGTYASLKNQWTASGYGDGNSFDTTFADYRNSKNKSYKLG